MGRTISIRLPPELAAWLDEAAARSGVRQDQFVREQLEKARMSGATRSFMRLAGSVNGPRSLSRRQGFSRR